MGVPMDRGLTRSNHFSESGSTVRVEMGVPMDRGLTQTTFCDVGINYNVVEMGVPMDRGLTQHFWGYLPSAPTLSRNGCPDG